MDKFELTDMNLQQLTAEQRLKITQGIVQEIVLALNLGNYSLIWRYFSKNFSERFTQETFQRLHQELTSKYTKLTTFELLNSILINDEPNNPQLVETWRLSTQAAHALTLTLTLVPVKEFLAIEELSITA
ncbi:hypothetical protein GCM10009123_22330 [Kangiella japonica]|uniref:Uncharacterized protein n=1 Tax=Kangiella japonica TaxID=647384 RepID=A0ABP3CT26_9GAMM